MKQYLSMQKIVGYPLIRSLMREATFVSRGMELYCAGRAGTVVVELTPGGVGGALHFGDEFDLSLDDFPWSNLEFQDRLSRCQLFSDNNEQVKVMKEYGFAIDHVPMDANAIASLLTANTEAPHRSPDGAKQCVCVVDDLHASVALATRPIMENTVVTAMVDDRTAKFQPRADRIIPFALSRVKFYDALLAPAGSVWEEIGKRIGKEVIAL